MSKVETRKASKEELKAFERVNNSPDMDTTVNNVTEDMEIVRNRTDMYGEKRISVSGLSWRSKTYKPAEEGMYTAELVSAKVDEERDALVLGFELTDLVTEERFRFNDWIRESRASYFIGGINQQWSTQFESIEEIVAILMRGERILIKLEPNPKSPQYLNTKYYVTAL